MNNDNFVLIPLSIFKSLITCQHISLSNKSKNEKDIIDDIDSQNIIELAMIKSKNTKKLGDIGNVSITDDKTTTTIDKNKYDRIQSHIQKFHEQRKFNEGVKLSSGLEYSCCRICGDAATKYSHYGGRSCFSCRIFFKRSVELSNR